MPEKYRLEPCTNEQVDAFNKDLFDLIEKHKIELLAVPVFVQETSSGKFMADAQVKIFNKVLIPDEQPAVQPSTTGAVPETPQA